MLDTCIVRLAISYASPLLLSYPIFNKTLIFGVNYIHGIFYISILRTKVWRILKISNYVLFIRVVGDGDEAISVYPSASFNVKFQSIINEGDINISCIFCVRANIFIVVNTVEKEFEQTLIQYPLKTSILLFVRSCRFLCI